MSMTLQSATGAAYAQQSSAPQSGVSQREVAQAAISAIAITTASSLLQLMITQLKSPQTIPRPQTIPNGYTVEEREISTGVVRFRAIQPHIILDPLITPDIDNQVSRLSGVQKQLYEIIMQKVVMHILACEKPHYAPYTTMLHFMQPDIGTDLARSRVIKSVVLFASRK